MNKFEQIPSQNWEKSCAAKSNAIVNSITESGTDYIINAVRVSSKLEKLTDEIIAKHNLPKSSASQVLIGDMLMKNALTRIAQDLGGNLRAEPSLEDRYFEILLNEIIIKNPKDYEEIVNLVKEHDVDDILDNDKKSELVNSLVEELL